jgi:hypothetical protein
MQWKTPLLLLLCAPLGYRAWCEFDRPADPTPRVELPPREDLAGKKTALQELQKTVDARTVDEALTSCIMLRSAEPPRSQAARPRSFEPLARALSTHSSAIGEVSEFARLYHELESDPGRPIDVRDADLKRWLEARRSVVKDKKDSEKILAAALDTLHRGVRAALRDREAAEMKLATENIEGILARLDRHRQNCEGFRVLAAWADRQLADGRLVRELLLVAREDAAISKAGQREDTSRHLREYARLLDMAGDNDMRTLIRTEAARFCDGYLPRRMDGDAMVLYRKVEVPREDIWILWKQGRPEAKRYGDEVRLVRTEYDEFRPPDLAAVEHYFRKVDKGDDTFSAQIRPTQRNQAARYFNVKRQTLIWNENALRKLLNDSPVHWPNEEAMPLPFRRAEHLLDAFNKQPTLFGKVE